MPQRFENLESFYHEVNQPGALVTISGEITAMGPTGLVAEGLSHVASLEDFVRISGRAGTALAEVVQVSQTAVNLRAIDPSWTFHLGDKVKIVGMPRFFPADSWKGRLINAVAEPLDGKGPLPQGPEGVGFNGKVLNALDRGTIDKRLVTGVCAVDVFTPLCFGQRMGIFAGSGVGKSTLLGMLAKAAAFDCVVVGLVGERGREANEFVRDVLGEALDKSIVVIATGDESAPMRKRAALLATAIAECFRDRGQNVLLLMDSVTRYAQALRDIALAGGEPPVSRGFPPSVFGALPQLLERAGPGARGSGTITGIYSVLVDGDNHNEPVADAVRGILDGHIVLDRRIAASGRFPAIDVLHSISRLTQRALNASQIAQMHELKSILSRFEETKDLRALGGYAPGKDAQLDRAATLAPQIYRYLRQSPKDEARANPFKDLAAITNGTAITP